MTDHQQTAPCRADGSPPSINLYLSLAENINAVLWEGTTTPLAFTFVSPQIETIFGIAPDV